MSKLAKLSADDILKLKAVTLYVTSKFDDVDIYKLFKIIYFADREHYAKYGRRIIPDTYISMVNGPVPSKLYDAIKISRGKRDTKLDPSLKTISDAFCVCKELGLDYVVKGIENPDMDELSKSDIICLDESIRENERLSFTKLKEKSHDIAWTEGTTNPKLQIRPILMAKAAGASDEMLAYLQEKEDISAILT